MTEAQARRLKVGDRVRWTDPDVEGTILGVGLNYIGVAYDDGEEGHLHPADCERLALADREED